MDYVHAARRLFTANVPAPLRAPLSNDDTELNRLETPLRHVLESLESVLGALSADRGYFSNSSRTPEGYLVTLI